MGGGGSKPSKHEAVTPHGSTSRIVVKQQRPAVNENQWNSARSARPARSEAFQRQAAVEDSGAEVQPFVPEDAEDDLEDIANETLREDRARRAQSIIRGNFSSPKKLSPRTRDDPSVPAPRVPVASSTSSSRPVNSTPTGLYGVKTHGQNPMETHEQGQGDSARHNAVRRTQSAMAGNVSRPSTGKLNWSMGEVIGTGAFGKVHLGMNLDTGELMAVKRVALNMSADVESQVEALRKEIAVMKRLHHENIVQYRGAEKDSEGLNIFLEYVPGGSVASLLRKFGALGEKVMRVYARQILSGLAYLHDNQIIHRDIKGANVLVTVDGKIKLADFGAAKEIVGISSVDGAMTLKGTPYWMAPEVIKGNAYGRAADIWSVACTCLEMATGKPPWSELGNGMAALVHIAHARDPPRIPDSLTPECKDFLLKCLSRDPSNRPSAHELLQHPWIQSMSPSPTPSPQASSRGRAAFSAAANQESHSESSSNNSPADRSPDKRPTAAVLAPVGTSQSSLSPNYSGTGVMSPPRSPSPNRLRWALKNAPGRGGGSSSHVDPVDSARAPEPIFSDERSPKFPSSGLDAAAVPVPPGIEVSSSDLNVDSGRSASSAGSSQITGSDRGLGNSRIERQGTDSELEIQKYVQRKAKRDTTNNMRSMFRSSLQRIRDRTGGGGSVVSASKLKLPIASPSQPKQTGTPQTSQPQEPDSQSLSSETLTESQQVMIAQTLGLKHPKMRSPSSSRRFSEVSAGPTSAPSTTPGARDWQVRQHMSTLGPGVGLLSGADTPSTRRSNVSDDRPIQNAYRQRFLVEERDSQNALNLREKEERAERALRSVQGR